MNISFPSFRCFYKCSISRYHVNKMQWQMQKSKYGYLKFAVFTKTVCTIIFSRCTLGHDTVCYIYDRLKLSDWENQISVLGFKHVRKSTVGGPDADRSFANMRVCALPQNIKGVKYSSNPRLCQHCLIACLSLRLQAGILSIFKSIISCNTLKKLHLI